MALNGACSCDWAKEVRSGTEQVPFEMLGGSEMIPYLHGLRNKSYIGAMERG